MLSEINSDIVFNQNSNVTFDGNKAEFGGAAYSSHKSNVVYGGNSLTHFHDNVANKDGGAMYFHNCNLTFTNNATVMFYNNTAISYGGALCSTSECMVMSMDSSRLIFHSNNAGFGGAIASLRVPENALDENVLPNSIDLYTRTLDKQAMCTLKHYGLIFGGTSTVIFTNNIAKHGGAAFSHLDMILDEYSMTTFINNSADYGGGLQIDSDGGTIFKGNSKVKFFNNTAYQNGGATYHLNMTHVIMQENSHIEFNGNSAKYNGGAMYLSESSDILVTNQCKCNVTFNHNRAANGGAMHCGSNSRFICTGNATFIFTNNSAALGGALHCSSNASILFNGYLNTRFNNNMATQGGAVYLERYSSIAFGQNSRSIFVNNIALEHGGALLIKHNSYIYYKDDCIVVCYNNNAANNGGSVHSESDSAVLFTGNSSITFNSSIAHNGAGGVIYSRVRTEVTFEGNSKINFTNNYAAQGGTIYFSDKSTLLFDENTTVSFSKNTAISGGALMIHENCNITFQGSEMSKIIFNDNKAEQYGGAIHLEGNSAVALKGGVTVKFSNNEATLGGAVYAKDKSNVTFKGNSSSKFYKNEAKMGGAAFLESSGISFMSNSLVTFYNNEVSQDGGAMYLNGQFYTAFKDDANITFSENIASDYGGAIYSRNVQSKIIINNSNTQFYDNHAETAGNSVFINVPISCNSSCLSNSILGISKDSLQHSYFKEHITTSPRKLTLYQPAYCIDSIENTTEGCKHYYVNNIMLGQAIPIDACMYDYYDRSAKNAAAEFSVTGDDDDQQFHIPGLKYVLVSCNNTFQGISLIGNNNAPILPSNYSMNIQLYVNRKSEMKTISVNLMVELVPCHPGFWYYYKSWRCECYNVSDIVYCSDSSSTIKRGYWFGSVDQQPTVTFCPINYCNFTCCETSNGYYQLSPVRHNQCMLHRSGTACGSCEEGFTLSFDSAKCVHTESCTTGQTILVVFLIIMYWAAVITMVFIMMNFRVQIGSLYAIIYYYSIVDLLLSQNWYLSSELDIIINVMSSITKVTPQFLGQLCLVKNLSGIDQQFIHYIHPMAVSVFLVLITMLARSSHRLSSLVSRVIIRVICCLLLLSYTSVTTTSLLLMRPLTFFDVDKVYTYVSPDVEYCHGHHLVYTIVAALSTIIIVIGLPLLLVLEPFLNSKINFIRIKPLLDQFQGIYQDKYRCFAGYYTICRLVIISIIIANSSNGFIAQYVLIGACVVIALIHQIFTPYSDNSLNIVDGVILQSMILVALLPLVDFFDKFDSNLAVGITLILLILPTVSFTTMKFMTNKKKMRKLLGQYYFKCMHINLHLRNYNEIPLNDNDQPSRDFSVTVDDSSRKLCAV